MSGGPADLDGPTAGETRVVEARELSRDLYDTRGGHDHFTVALREVHVELRPAILMITLEHPPACEHSSEEAAVVWEAMEAAMDTARPR